jgi:hypothetical protein
LRKTNPILKSVESFASVKETTTEYKSLYDFVRNSLSIDPTNLGIDIHHANTPHLTKLSENANRFPSNNVKERSMTNFPHEDHETAAVLEWLQQLSGQDASTLPTQTSNISMNLSIDSDASAIAALEWMQNFSDENESYLLSQFVGSQHLLSHEKTSNMNDFIAPLSVPQSVQNDEKGEEIHEEHYNEDGVSENDQSDVDAILTCCNRDISPSHNQTDDLKRLHRAEMNENDVQITQPLFQENCMEGTEELINLEVDHDVAEIHELSQQVVETQLANRKLELQVLYNQTRGSILSQNDANSVAFTPISQQKILLSPKMINDSTLNDDISQLSPISHVVSDQESDYSPTRSTLSTQRASDFIRGNQISENQWLSAEWKKIPQLVNGQYEHFEEENIHFSQDELSDHVQSGAEKDAIEVGSGSVERGGWGMKYQTKSENIESISEPNRSLSSDPHITTTMISEHENDHLIGSIEDGGSTTENSQSCLSQLEGEENQKKGGSYCDRHMFKKIDNWVNDTIVKINYHDEFTLTESDDIVGLEKSTAEMSTISVDSEFIAELEHINKSTVPRSEGGQKVKSEGNQNSSLAFENTNIGYDSRCEKSTQFTDKGICDMENGMNHEVENSQIDKLTENDNDKLLIDDDLIDYRGVLHVDHMKVNKSGIVVSCENETRVSSFKVYDPSCNKQNDGMTQSCEGVSQEVSTESDGDKGVQNCFLHNQPHQWDDVGTHDDVIDTRNELDEKKTFMQKSGGYKFESGENRLLRDTFETAIDLAKLGKSSEGSNKLNGDNEHENTQCEEAKNEWVMVNSNNSSIIGRYTQLEHNENLLFHGEGTNINIKESSNSEEKEELYVQICGVESQIETETERKSDNMGGIENREDKYHFPEIEEDYKLGEDGIWLTKKINHVTGDWSERIETGKEKSVKKMNRSYNQHEQFQEMSQEYENRDLDKLNSDSDYEKKSLREIEDHYVDSDDGNGTQKEHAIDDSIEEKICDDEKGTNEMDVKDLENLVTIMPVRFLYQQGDTQSPQWIIPRVQTDRQTMSFREVGLRNTTDNSTSSPLKRKRDDFELEFSSSDEGIRIPQVDGHFDSPECKKKKTKEVTFGMDVQMQLSPKKPKSILKTSHVQQVVKHREPRRPKSSSSHSKKISKSKLEYMRANGVILRIGEWCLRTSRSQPNRRYWQNQKTRQTSWDVPLVVKEKMKIKLEKSKGPHPTVEEFFQFLEMKHKQKESRLRKMKSDSVNTKMLREDDICEDHNGLALEEEDSISKLICQVPNEKDNEKREFDKPNEIVRNNTMQPSKIKKRKIIEGRQSDLSVNKIKKLYLQNERTLNLQNFDEIQPPKLEQSNVDEIVPVSDMSPQVLTKMKKERESDSFQPRKLVSENKNCQNDGEVEVSTQARQFFEYFLKKAEEGYKRKFESEPKKSIRWTDKVEKLENKRSSLATYQKFFPSKEIRTIFQHPQKIREQVEKVGRLEENQHPTLLPRHPSNRRDKLHNENVTLTGTEINDQLQTNHSVEDEKETTNEKECFSPVSVSPTFQALSPSSPQSPLVMSLQSIRLSPITSPPLEFSSPLQQQSSSKPPNSPLILSERNFSSKFISSLSSSLSLQSLCSQELSTDSPDLDLIIGKPMETDQNINRDDEDGIIISAENTSIQRENIMDCSPKRKIHSDQVVDVGIIPNLNDSEKNPTGDSVENGNEENEFILKTNRESLGMEVAQRDDCGPTSELINIPNVINSSVVSSALVSTSPRHEKKIILFENTDHSLHVYQRIKSPPSLSELISTMENFRIPTVVYEEPYFEGTDEWNRNRKVRFGCLEYSVQVKGDTNFLPSFHDKCIAQIGTTFSSNWANSTILQQNQTFFGKNKYRAFERVRCPPLLQEVVQWNDAKFRSKYDKLNGKNNETEVEHKKTLTEIPIPRSEDYVRLIHSFNAQFQNQKSDGQPKLTRNQLKIPLSCKMRYNSSQIEGSSDSSFEFDYSFTQLDGKRVTRSTINQHLTVMAIEV